jgi:tetratricopeptide (TPR) repeat protein
MTIFSMLTPTLLGLRIALVATVVIIPLHLIWFVWIPSRLLKQQPAKGWKLRFVELIAASPSLLGSSVKAVARIGLLGPYMLMGRHREIVELARAMLAHGMKQPDLEADVRLRLADALESLGESAAAQAEREKAADCLGGTDETSLGYINLAKMLARQNRHGEACAMLERGLELVPPEQSAVRIEILGHLSVSGYQAGRLDDAIYWAELGLSEGATGTIRKLLHRMAGACCNDQGRLDQAEAHKRAALELAEAEGEPKAISDGLSDVADMLRKRGKLAEALPAAERAANAAPGDCRHAKMVQYEILKALGRFDEARATLEEAARAKGLQIPAMERRSQAVFDLSRAWLLVEMNQPEPARQHLRLAQHELHDDARLSLWCTSAEAWIAAVEGHEDEFVRLAQETESALVNSANDRNTLTGAFSSLGRGACVIGDWERGLRYWNRYFDAKPDPVNRPRGLFHQGLCLEGLGRESEARASWREAADMGIDTHYARLAASKLRTLSPRPLV